MHDGRLAMSLHRIAAAQRLCAAGIGSLKRTRNVPLSRWQSSAASPRSRGGRAVRLLLYGAAGSGLVATGSLVYAGQDPAFKSSVDLYLPGFAATSDAVMVWAGKGAGKGAEPGFSVEVVAEPPKEDPFQRLARRRASGRGSPKADPPPARQEEKNPRDDVTMATEKTAKEPADIPSLSSSVKAEPSVSSMEAKPAVSSMEAEPAVSSFSPDSQSEEPAAVRLASLEESTSQPLVPSSSVESTVAMVKEEAAQAAEQLLAVQLAECRDAQAADQGLHWLKDSAEVGNKLASLYESFTDVSERVKAGQQELGDKMTTLHRLVSDAMALPSMQRSEEEAKEEADLIVEAEGAVASCRSELAAAEQAHEAASVTLQALLTTASGLGLRSKVEQLEARLAGTAAELMVGAAAVAAVEAEGRVLEEYRARLEKGREQLQRELGVALPEADTKQEAMLLLLQSRVQLLRRRVAQLEEGEAAQLARALEQQKRELDLAGEEQLKWRLQKQAHDFEQELKEKLDEVDEDYSLQLREELRGQSDKHAHHLSEALERQSRQLGASWAGELEHRLQQQHNGHQLEMAAALARLRGIETMVNTVAAAGETTRQQQGLRATCDTLLAAMERANANPDPREHFSFSAEVAALAASAGPNHFIAPLLASLPREALGPQGLQSEAGLRERFRKVKRICRRVALVPAGGAGLAVYALSYLQSLLTLSVWPANADSASSDTDTFTVLVWADACLSRGELEQAIRLVGTLRGEPGRVAADWLHEARLYLEARQTALLIQQYLTATSLSLTQ